MSKEEKDRLSGHLADIHMIITRFDGCETTKRNFLNSLETILDRIYKMSK